VTAEGRRMVGYGLLAGAIGITLLMLLWLAIAGAAGGGIVLGLLLVLVLAGPLAGAGWYVLAQGRAERVEEQQFTGKRRILDADRLFRRELAARLSELQNLPGVPSNRIQMISRSLDRTVADESAWYSAIQLDDAQIGLLAQYDDLVWEQVRWLGDHAGEDAATVGQTVDQLQQAVEQRTDLLVRGRQAPAVSPATMMRAPLPRPESKSLEDLAVGDALTREGVDYVVERLASSFSDGETRKLAHLVPSGAGEAEHWLSISPRALELAWLDSIEAPAPGATTIVVGDAHLSLVDSKSSLVRVDARDGSAAAPGVLVQTWRYRAGDRVGVIEQWPDGAVLAYAGKTLPARELEVWPAK
jgi:Domain of unknown function (DUF4178)